MEWLLIPGIFLVAAVISGVIDWVKSRPHFDHGAWVVMMALCIILCILSILSCSISYYVTRNDALRAEAYYEQIVTPAIVEEYENYVVVDSTQTAIWQAGEMNLSNYNAYLKSMRYWDGVPVIGTCVYGPPDCLKFVRVI